MPALEFDFVYKPNEEELGFKNLHVALDVVKDADLSYCFELIITSDEEIDNANLLNIVEELKKQRFKKMNIDMSADCIIIVSTADRTYEITFNELKDAAR